MKLHTGGLLLWAGHFLLFPRLALSIPSDFSLAASSSHMLSRPRATADLSGPGLLRILQSSLGDEDFNILQGNVTVQCILASWDLSTTCRRFRSRAILISRAGSCKIWNANSFGFFWCSTDGNQCVIAPSELNFVCPI